MFAKGYRCLSSTLCGVYTLLLQRCFLSDLDSDFEFSMFAISSQRGGGPSIVSLRRVESAFAALFSSLESYEAIDNNYANIDNNYANIRLVHST
jgi:hypothetical protein